MSKLRRLTATFCLLSALAATALAGEIQSPPCSTPDPGEIQSPPCSTAQPKTDDPTKPGYTEVSPAADTIVIAVVEAAVGAFLSVV